MVDEIIIIFTFLVILLFFISSLIELKGSPKSKKLIRYKNNLDISRELLLSDIKNCKRSLHIVLNKYYHPIFNYDPIIESIMEAQTRNVDIIVITGPNFDKEKENILRNLNKDNTICLYVKKEMPAFSFRVIDTDIVHIEKGNLRETENCIYSRYINNRFKALVYEKKFHDILNRQI